MCVSCMYVVACRGNEVKKFRFGSPASIPCEPSSAVDYSWTINNEPVTEDTSGIDSRTINDKILRITSMTPQLEGMYRCTANGGTIDITFDVKVVGKLFYCFSRIKIILVLFCTGVADYSLCIDGQCPVNYTYNFGSSYTLNATLEFRGCGADCLKEDLVDPEWILNPDSGGTTIMNNEVNPPGFNITTVSYQDSTINIAMVRITNANTTFQIKHLIHTNIDGEHGQQRSIIFNFNYTEGKIYPKLFLVGH